MGRSGDNVAYAQRTTYNVHNNSFKFVDVVVVVVVVVVDVFLLLVSSSYRFMA